MLRVNWNYIIKLYLDTFVLKFAVDLKSNVDVVQTQFPYPPFSLMRSKAYYTHYGLFHFKSRQYIATVGQGQQ